MHGMISNYDPSIYCNNTVSASAPWHFHINGCQWIMQARRDSLEADFGRSRFLGNQWMFILVIHDVYMCLLLLMFMEYARYNIEMSIYFSQIMFVLSSPCRAFSWSRSDQRRVTFDHRRAPEGKITVVFGRSRTSSIMVHNNRYAAYACVDR